VFISLRASDFAATNWYLAHSFSCYCASLAEKEKQSVSIKGDSWTICLIVTYWSGISTMISTNVSTPAICENIQE